MKKSRFAVPALLCALALLSVPRCSGEKQRKSPDIILISIDTLRADYFTAERMPLVHQFALDNGLIYTNACSTSTWTKPSHLTMLTGLLQSEHGVEFDDSVIPAGVVMVQEKLKAAGYRTAAFTGGGYVSREWGFDRGFDTYWQHPVFSKDPIHEQETFAERFRSHLSPIDHAERYLAGSPRQPLFVFVHTYFVHDYWTKYFPKDKKIIEEIEELRREERFSGLARPHLGKFMNDATPEERRRLYAEAVLECDERLAKFLEFIEKSPRLSNAKIIITSDHGEGLGDIHEDIIMYHHAAEPYSDQIRVPLIVCGTGAGKTDRLVGVDDIAGTILKFTGVDDNPPKSLFRERDILISENIQLQRNIPARAVSVISGREKYFLSETAELNLFRDRNESTDLIDSPHSNFAGWAASEGLYGEEGPYPQWDTPVVRWGYGPRTTLRFIGDGKSACLALSLRRNESLDQAMQIFLNGNSLEEYRFGPDMRFHHLLIPLQTRKGENTLTFEYRHQQDDRQLAVCFKRIMILPEDSPQSFPKELLDWHSDQFPFFGWEAATGLEPEEGPFPELNLPVIRWGLWPQTELVFESDASPLVLTMLCGTHHLQWQEMKLLLNGEQVGAYRLEHAGEFKDIRLELSPRTGQNSLVIEYEARDDTDPERPFALLFKRLRIVPPALSGYWLDTDEEN